MKRVRYETVQEGDLFGYVVTVDKKKVAEGHGFATEQKASMEGYKEKQRQVNKLFGVKK